MKKLRNFLVASLAVLTTLILFELCLHAFKSDDLCTTIRGSGVLCDVAVEYNVKNISVRGLSKIDYVRDAHGLRGDCESVKRIEILTIGGSTTDQRYLSLRDTWQGVMQRELRNTNPSFGCVANAGVDGHSTLGHVWSFEHWLNRIPDLSPRYIILYVGINDADYMRDRKKGYPGSSDIGFLNSIYRNSALLQEITPIFLYLYQKISNPFYAGHTPRKFSDEEYNVVDKPFDSVRVTENGAEFRNRMEKLMSLVQRDFGSKVICVSQPTDYVRKFNGKFYGLPKVGNNGLSGLDFHRSLNEINRVLASVCEKGFIDLHRYSFDAADFYDGIHMNEHGSEKVGKLIAKWMVDHSMD